MQKIATKRRILLVMIELLDRMEGAGLTVKYIASQAECSASAINYYFASKEYLIQVAQNIITEQSDLETVLQQKPRLQMKSPFDDKT